MDCKHVMIVDDDETIRDCLIDVLESEGYDVYSAENGQAALDKLSAMKENELPGCILLDLMMPVMDGVTFMHTVENSNNENLNRIPVLVTSANLNYYAASGLTHAAQTLKKPLDLDQIYKAVHYYCGDPTYH